MNPTASAPPARIMGIGPVPAVRKVLDRAGLKVDEIDVFDVNEAFAAQALAVVREVAHLCVIEDISEFDRLEIHHFYEVYKALEPDRPIQHVAQVGHPRRTPVQLFWAAKVHRGE
jgi:Thiolase, C-terminal domain